MKEITKYFGVILGALYGVIIRIIGGIEAFNNFYNIYSISFIWVTPIVIGLIPLFFSSNEIYKSKSKSFFYPIFAVILFGILSLITRLEDIICLFILGFPFLIIAGLTGIAIGSIIKNNKINRKHYSIILIPLLLNPIENLIPNIDNIYIVESKVVIDRDSKVIWDNLIEVPEIAANEYEMGIFNYAGIPRPIKSKIETKDGVVYRVGYFTDNVKLYESITHKEENEFVNFNIHIDKSQLRNNPTDQHLLKSKDFAFENISYTLVPLDSNKTELILKCEYRIKSKMNSYANFWAESIIKDFEIRLLNALKLKIEKV